MIAARGLGRGGAQIVVTGGLGARPSASRAAVMRGGGAAGRSSGPDAQLSLADYIRRTGAAPRAAVPSRLPARVADDEAIAMLLCSLVM